jgi:hypothetical protein
MLCSYLNIERNAQFTGGRHESFGRVGNGAWHDMTAWAKSLQRP